MHAHSIDEWRHEHVFLGADHERNERRSWAVVALCAAMMTAEIVGGFLWGSMALIADGLHMSTHAAALVIAALAYAYARRHARDARFAFGTGKLGDLAAFASAIVLAMIALLIGWESVGRLFRPVPIAFGEAIPLAALGLAVNLVCALLLREEGEHGAASGHGHGHDHHHHDHADHNLRAAYLHVTADAAVSLLALVGLSAGRLLGWVWMDPAMGIIGALVIANWSWSLVRSAGAVLLDIQPDAGLVPEITRRLEGEGEDRIADLHIWRIGPGHNAAVVSLVSDRPEAPAVYKARLAGLAGLSHVTVEVQRCPGAHERRDGELTHPAG
jgi:cation diffusion facilitator family transporter